MPPLAFALQELLELSLHTGTFAWRAALAPTFLPGLLLQLPCAVLMYVAARLLLRAAERIGLALAPTVASGGRSVVLAIEPSAPPIRFFAGRRLARAPPRLATSLT